MLSLFDPIRTRQIMIPSSLRQRWLVIMLAGATLVSATLGIRQVFGLFLQPISLELGTGFQLFSLAIATKFSVGFVIASIWRGSGSARAMASRRDWRAALWWRPVFDGILCH